MNSLYRRFDNNFIQDIKLIINNLNE